MVVLASVVYSPLLMISLIGLGTRNAAGLSNTLEAFPGWNALTAAFVVGIRSENVH